jgi:hypothetical protein
VLEPLGIGVAVHFPESGRARPHPGLHGLEVADLARVAGDGLELQGYGLVMSTTSWGCSHWIRCTSRTLWGSSSGRSSGNDR